MIRTQISISEDQARRLRNAATRRGVSVAHVVREAIDAHVSDHESIGAERIRRALAAAGRFNSGRADVSARHDDYLAEDPRGW